MTFFEYIKNILLILLFIQIAPVLIKSIRKQYSRYLKPRTPVGVLTIKGILYDSTEYNKQLYYFFKNPEIKALLIKMNCLGSAAGTGQIIFNEIQILKKEYPKPVIVLVENVCASGGYLIACATDHIIAPPSAIIGSIGSYFSSIQLREFIESHKIHYTVVKTGTYKAIANPFVDLTEKERALLQELQDDAYKSFTQTVAKERKLSLTNSNDWADGKIFTGNQALEQGLIDEIGSAQNAIKALKEKALIEGEIEWIKTSTQTGLLNLLGNPDTMDDNSLFTTLLNNVCTFLENRYGTAMQR